MGDGTVRDSPPRLHPGWGRADAAAAAPGSGAPTYAGGRGAPRGAHPGHASPGSLTGRRPRRALSPGPAGKVRSGQAKQAGPGAGSEAGSGQRGPGQTRGCRKRVWGCEDAGMQGCVDEGIGDRGCRLLTWSSSGGSRGLSSKLSNRTGAWGLSRSLRRAPRAALTSRGSPSPSAPRSAGSSAPTCRTCGVQRGQLGGHHSGWPAPTPRAPYLTLPCGGSAPGARGPAGPANARWAQGHPASCAAAPGPPLPATAASWACSAIATGAGRMG